MAYKIKSTLKKKSTKSKNKYTKKRGKIIKRKGRKTIKRKIRRIKQKGRGPGEPQPPPPPRVKIKFEDLEDELEYGERICEGKMLGEKHRFYINKQTIKLNLLIDGKEKCAIQVFIGTNKGENYTIIPGLIGFNKSKCNNDTWEYVQFDIKMKKLFEKLKQKFTTSFVLKEINENMEFNEAIFIKEVKKAEELNALYKNTYTSIDESFNPDANNINSSLANPMYGLNNTPEKTQNPEAFYPIVE
jgi:hypothetical protein